MKKILISGAGVAGLSLAICLQRMGIPFNLIEKSQQLNFSGAGIALPANAVKALRYIGLGEALDNCAHRVSEIIYTKANGKVLSRASLREPPYDYDYFVALHRKQLYQILLQQLKEEIIFNTQIKTLKQTDNGVMVTFSTSNLKNETYAAVIGADGINSSVRRLVFHDSELVDLGMTTWRWLSAAPAENLQPTYMLGSKALLMGYPIQQDTVYCYAHICDPNNAYAHSLNHTAVLQEQFKKFAGIAPKLLASLPTDTEIIQGRLRSVAQPLFSQGKVALIGDASSACSPTLQQGAASALEDVIVLSELLKYFNSNIEKAFKFYENYRRQRVNWVVNASDTPMKMAFKANSRLSLFLRDLLIKFKGPINMQGWRQLFATDPIAGLENYIADCKL
ncbi:MAG: NAD(P)/FAD-dependent oxidoreductase [Pseudomonadota bacterium]